ncbi:MAG: NAD(P)(+) transhydrogenase (Re/Si-specific) subunit beta [Proteobacteria bacterium]|nr:NAD(P)(+) transhydrogenase (Re/Si-specific) subunit beta [Pseudomonadota bacterium]
MDQNLATLLYLAASVCFILALRGLSHPETSRAGNRYGVIGMAIAVVITLALLPEIDFVTILAGVVVGGSIGTVIALRIQMTALPQLVAAFHSLVGLAAVLVAAAAFYNPTAYGIGVPGEIEASSLIEMAIGTSIGAITFTGSVIAFAKLQALMSGRPIVFPLQHWLNLGLGILAVLLVVWLASAESGVAFWLIVVVSLVLGVLIIIPIGGADMPVVISMLNSYSGWAACGIGFTLQNNLLIVAGALVGSSGAILSYIMCKGMNRSFVSVILGGFGGEVAGPAAGEEGEKTHREGSAEDAAFIMRNAEKVIIVPGYGFAVAQAQHALREMADLLKAEGVEVKYAIHPVAGRMPGHMNVLLAEANVPYDEVFEMDEINRELAAADVAFVIGANDVVNPAARTDKTSPIYGMPIIDVDKAQQIFVVKRSLASGYAGVDNPLFYMDSTMMLLSDAKAMCEKIVRALEA